MTTTQLIALQKAITQGEWKADRVSVFSLTSGVLHKHVATAELGASECEANAQAIAAVPQLIAEVIKLREALNRLLKGASRLESALTNDDANSALAGLIEDSNIVRSALSNS